MNISLKSSSLWNGLGEVHVERFPFFLGRHRDNDCALPLAFVSRQHCQITLQGDNVFIQDLESHNGTFVNGRRISKPTRIEDGDELALGPLNFRVTTSAPTGENGASFQAESTRQLDHTALRGTQSPARVDRTF
jgi:pSer/pThr/pTyr-binding forkhead associated (FHA) protein